MQLSLNSCHVLRGLKFHDTLHGARVNVMLRLVMFLSCCRALPVRIGLLLQRVDQLLQTSFLPT